jgi:hypothetical protein
MIDPEIVIAQVRQGNVPPTWQVLRSNAKPFLSGVGCGFIMLFPASALALLVTTLISNMPTTVRAILSYIPHKTLLMVIIAVVVVGIFVTFREVKAKDGVLVFMPDGMVQCSEYSKPTRSFQGGYAKTPNSGTRW